MDERATRATRQLERWWLSHEREHGPLDADAGDCLVLTPSGIARLLCLELR